MWGCRGKISKDNSNGVYLKNSDPLSDKSLEFFFTGKLWVGSFMRKFPNKAVKFTNAPTLLPLHHKFVRMCMYIL